MRVRSAGACVVWVLAAVAFVLSTADADVVLLDEYWTPDITTNDVAVTEIDSRDTGRPEEAKSGEYSVLLENETGWPNVRFRGASTLLLSELSPEDCQASLWYRTDAWQGAWRLEVWVSAPDLAPAPVKVMEATLDGGGPDGKLIADNEWHQAKGLLYRAGEFENLPDNRVPSYVWLVPTDGWGIAHRTFVDRVEVNVLAGPRRGEPVQEPPARIRPRPGEQETGDGWMWFEGEDAVSHNFQPGGPWAPDTREEQAKLSNGATLQMANGDIEASWRVEVPQDGTYGFWGRMYVWDGQFQWRWDDGAWGTCNPGLPLDRAEWVRWGLPLYWTKLGDVDLAAGVHTLQVEDIPESSGFCFDCWLLSRDPIKPSGIVRPGAALARGEMGSVVLLDEQWSPEIAQNDVLVTEVFADGTAGAVQARSGRVCAMLENTSGAPNVRFRGAGFLVPSELRIDALEGRLWYRTDAWDGVWNMEVWLHDEDAYVPVKVLEGMLDGGGPGGSLIADDGWHQARATLAPGDGYAQLAKSVLPAACYVWLSPREGWDIPHRTYVDRVELIVTDAGGAEPPAPATRVTPRPGAQVTGEGWIWVEGEDAVEQDLRQRGGYAPTTAEQQARLSNGAWLEGGDVAGCTIRWKVDVKEAARYTIWGRGFAADAPFRLKWDDGPWQDLPAELQPLDPVVVVAPYLVAMWAELGEAVLTRGEHDLTIEFEAGARAIALDCWLLTQEPFTPNGTHKPGEQPGN